MTLDNFYVFVDTNLLYDERLDHKLFNSGEMKELLKIRDNYNDIYGDYKQILLHFTEIVAKEIFSIKNETSKQKLKEATNNLQYLESDILKMELETLETNFTEKLRSNGNSFISENNIIIVPCCSDCYFKNIVQKALDKKMPFKPKFDERKKRHIGDNGFKDTIIWYSIIDYIKNQDIKENDQIILLTNNILDFKSDDTSREFESLTGKKVHIINFGSTKCTDSKSSEFLSLILENSKNFEIETINIFYRKINNKIQIHSVKGSPFYFDLASLFPKSMDSEDFESKIEPEIKSKFSSFGFNVKDLKFNFIETQVIAVIVNLRNYKFWFIDIDSIELEFDSGIFVEEFGFDVNFSTDLEEYIADHEEESKIDKDFRATISSILEDRGYHHIDPDCIEYEVVEFIPPDD